MATTRELMLREKYKKMLDKPMISIGDIDDLMQQVDKVLQNIRDITEGRDKWKKKYDERCDDCKMLSKEIQRLENNKFKKLKEELNKNANSN